MSETVLRSVRLALASLIAVALLSHLLIGLTNDTGLTIISFFSDFSVLSNAAAVVLLAMLSADPKRDGELRFAQFRGAVTVCMTITLIVYVGVLYPQQVDVGDPEPWIEMTIHVVGPLLIGLDWLVNRPPLRLPKSTVLWWLAVPTASLTYSLIRAPITDWYPYPFLDPVVQGGYFWVALWCVLSVAVIATVGWLFYWWSNRSAPKHATA